MSSQGGDVAAGVGGGERTDHPVLVAVRGRRVTRVYRSSWRATRRRCRSTDRRRRQCPTGRRRGPGRCTRPGAHERSCRGRGGRFGSVGLAGCRHRGRVDGPQRLPFIGNRSSGLHGLPGAAGLPFVAFGTAPRGCAACPTRRCPQTRSIWTRSRCAHRGATGRSIRARVPQRNLTRLPGQLIQVIDHLGRRQDVWRTWCRWLVRACQAGILIVAVSLSLLWC